MINLKDILLPILILRKTQLCFYLILKLFPLIDVKYEKGEMFDILTQSFLYYNKIGKICSFVGYYKDIIQNVKKWYLILQTLL